MQMEPGGRPLYPLMLFNCICHLGGYSDVTVINILIDSLTY